jgi:hypothetical protein
MRTVLVLSAVGMLSLGVLWSVDTAPPAAVETPPVLRTSTAVSEVDAADWDKEAESGGGTLLSEESRRELVRQQVLPASAESAPVLEYDRISRAGPERHLKVKKQPPPEQILKALEEQVIQPDGKTRVRDHRLYSRAGPYFHSKQKPIAAKTE